MVKQQNLSETKFCLNCSKLIPAIKYDTLGRCNTRTSCYCDMNCRNKFIIAKNPEKNKQYHKDYYVMHLDKFVKKTKVEI